jgi:carboxymethylenebutenolidase
LDDLKSEFSAAAESSFEPRRLPGRRDVSNNCGMKHIALAIVPVLIAFSTLAFAQTKPAAIPAAGENAKAAIDNSPRHGEWVDIDVEGEETKLRAWVVYPERKDKAPVVLVIHEIFGLTDWVRAVADQLAADGFIAIAPDLLSGKGEGGGGTESFAEGDVRAAIRGLTPEEVARRLDAARAYGLSLPAATDKSATIGFCWGGTASFNYATHQRGLNAAIVYYGTGPTDKETLETIQCPVLGFYGEDDARVTSTVEPTAAAMKELQKSFTSHIYPGAGHGFLRQQDGREGANLKASQEAWRETVEFLRANLE